MSSAENCRKEENGYEDVLFISEGLNQHSSEGYTKYANRIAAELKKGGGTVIGYGHADGDIQDLHVKGLNSFAALKLLLRQKQKHILVAPWVIDRWCLLLILLYQMMGRKCRLLIIWYPQPTPSQKRTIQTVFRVFHPDLYLAAKDVYEDFQQWYRGNLYHVSAAVDTGKFVPVSPERKRELREKYGLPQDKLIFFHAGHIVRDRRLDWLLHLPENCLGVMACSSFWNPDQEIYGKLKEKQNVRILSEDYPHIEELFQAIDVYVFTPTVNGAIRTPLSVFEAMACNQYVVSTRHGELAAVEEGDGLVYVDGADPQKTVSAAMELLNHRPPCHTREKTLGYDWNAAVENLIHW